MAERHFRPERLHEICVTLERVLQALDDLELHLPAIHVAMALAALGKERELSSKHGL